MIIQHNIMALNSNRQLGTNNSAVAKNLEKLSSGYKINRAGDDAAGLAISEKMRSQIKGLEVAQVNAQDAISLIQTAEGALTEVHSMLNRMVELSTKAANGTYADVDRSQLQQEMDSLLEEIDRIASSTNFNGTSLLSGSDLNTATSVSTLTFQIGDTSKQTVSMDLKNMSTVGLQLNGANFNISTLTNAQAAIDTINRAISLVSAQRATFGAMQNRLEHTINNLGVTTENMTAAESRIRDTDMATEMMAYTKNTVLVQAAQAMLAQANTQPQSVLQLLQ